MIGTLTAFAYPALVLALLALALACIPSGRPPPD